MQVTMDLDSTVPTLDQQINDIMNRFNFARVLTVMHAINWTWRGEVVDLNDLKSTAMQMMDDAVRSYHANAGSWVSVGTGGFTARVEDQKGSPRVSLAFSVESVDAYMY